MLLQGVPKKCTNRTKSVLYLYLFHSFVTLSLEVVSISEWSNGAKFITERTHQAQVDKQGEFSLSKVLWVISTIFAKYFYRIFLLLIPHKLHIIMKRWRMLKTNNSSKEGKTVWRFQGWVLLLRDKMKSRYVSTVILIWDYSLNCNYIQWSGRSMTIFWWNVQSKTFANGQFKNFTAETWNIKYFFLSYFFLNLFMFLVLLMVMVWNILILVWSRFKSRYQSWSLFKVLKQIFWQTFGLIRFGQDFEMEVWLTFWWI